MRNYWPLLGLCSTLGCSDASVDSNGRFTSHTVSKPGEVDSGNGEKKTAAPTAEAPLPPSETAMLPVDPVLPDTPSASIPVAIGGASLTCSLVSAEPFVQCQILNNGVPIEGLTQAYMITGALAQWTMVNLVPVNKLPGSYRIALDTAGRTDFGIAILYTDDKAAIDWIKPEGLSAFNLLVDGGFEHPPIAAGATITQFESSDAYAWKAIPTANSNCAPGSRGIIEIQNSGVEGSKPTLLGSTKWLELDAVCADLVTGNTGNMLVYQEANVVAENYYQVRFSLARRSNDGTNLQSIIVRANGVKLLTQESVNTTWTNHSFIIKATAAKVKLEFEETGFANRFGTLVDNVQLINLGLYPQIVRSK